MNLNVLHKKPRMSSVKSAPTAGPKSTQPEMEVIHVETSAKRPIGGPVLDQAAASRPGKWVKIAVRKHKSHRDEGSSRRATREKEPEMADWASRDLNAAMQARWLNLSYQAKVWDDSEAASEFVRGVLHPTLAKDRYTLPSEVLIARAVKQIALGHHYQMAFLDRVHDSACLVTYMGNQASLLETEIEKLKTEGDREENEFLKAELPGKSVANYKQSIGFGWGLRRMGLAKMQVPSQTTLTTRYRPSQVDANLPRVRVGSLTSALHRTRSPVVTYRGCTLPL
ncbi:hypothetical protein B296_00044941 [Ensete ventricosum]|uniref:Uncharacterized protein n=1 Tax=Ensete ventricosum TaxID=4639 RepID=A0A426XTU4_ENSVE|nr:hypothetical protein B296_00044941 [Ensete ventricosum]